MRPIHRSTRSSRSMRALAALATAAAVLAVPAVLSPASTAATESARGSAPASAPASAAERAVPKVEVAQSAAAVKAYWTPERMAAAAAKPERPAKRPTTSAPVSGPEFSVPPTEAVDGSATESARLAKAVAASPPELTLYGRPYTSAAEKASGKVFYTTPSGVDNNCSASTITAGNKSLVWTAAHCVGAGYTNIAYVPAYNSGNTGGGWGDGDAPYGIWPARTFFPGTYPDNDHTGIVVSQVGGRYLQDVVGSQGVRFNTNLTGETITIIGYPAARIYDGADMTWCTNAVTSFNQTGRVTAECDTEGGSSGGPYVIDNTWEGGLGWQVATHSQGGGTTALGDPFDSLAAAIYNRASVA